MHDAISGLGGQSAVCVEGGGAFIRNMNRMVA